MSKRFPNLAQSIFVRFPDKVRAHGSHLLLFCVDPLPDNAREPRSEIYIFRHPDFAAERVHNIRVVSIGSGTTYYENALRDFNSNPYSYLQLATAGPAGIARYLGGITKKCVQEKPANGVSPHLHVCVVSTGGTVIEPNDEKWSQAGQVVEDFKMPWVAQSMIDLKQFLAARGLSAAQAVC